MPAPTAFLTRFQSYTHDPEGQEALAQALEAGVLTLTQTDRAHFPGAALKALRDNVVRFPIIRKVVHHDAGLQRIFNAMLKQGGTWWPDHPAPAFQPFAWALELGMLRVAFDLLEAPGAPPLSQLDTPSLRLPSNRASAPGGAPPLLHPLFGVLHNWQNMKPLGEHYHISVEAYRDTLTRLHTEYGFGLNHQRIDTGNTLLHEAVTPHIVEHLLTLGARPDVLNHAGEDPPSFWRTHVPHGTAKEMLQIWRERTQSLREALPEAERAARAMATAQSHLMVKSDFVSHLAQWGLKGHEKAQDGTDWMRHLIHMFQAHFLESLVFKAQHTDLYNHTVIWKQADVQHPARYTPLPLNDTTRELLLGSNAPPIGEAVWPFLKKHCLKTPNALEELLTWGLLAPNVHPNNTVNYAYRHALTRTFSQQILLGIEPGTLFDLPSLWRRARVSFAALATPLHKTSLRSVMNKMKKTSAPIEEQKQEILLSHAPHYAEGPWMLGTLKIMEEYRLPLTREMFESWCHITSAWAVQERYNFWHTLGCALSHHIHFSPYAPVKEWSAFLKKVPLDKEAWMWLLPLLHAEFNELDNLAGSKASVFLTSHGSLTQDPLKPRPDREGCHKVSPYLYAHTLFKKTKALLDTYGPPSPEHWSALHPFFEKPESSFGKMAGPVYAAYLNARLEEEVPSLSSSRRLRV